MVNYFNMFLVYANKTDDNNHDDDISYTQNERRDKNTYRKERTNEMFNNDGIRWKRNG